jgi:hypothetical protein
MKGVSLRVGASQGHAESHDELRLVDQGDFVITNKRVIFCGSKRTVTIDFDQIVGTGTYEDGLRINREHRDRPFIFGFDANLSTLIDGVTFYAEGSFVDGILDQAKSRPTPVPVSNGIH